MESDDAPSGSRANRRSSTASDLFPDYEDVVEIGRGGMGVVYKARHKSNGHPVVLKTMIGSEDRQLKRFRREAEALAQIKHRNIVSIKTVGQIAGCHYFAMEYVEGESLADRVSASLSHAGHPPDHEWSVRIFEALASGLALCHEKGIVHRDVKPDNIVIGYDERPVLVDFGLVKRLDPGLSESVQKLTETGQMLGTPGFLPPEQLEVKGEYGRIGPASDVWSLGATLYYCLCGEQPFGKMPFSAWCFAMLENPLPPAHTLNPTVPLWLSELCQECLDRNPRKRPTMKALKKRLGRPVAEVREGWGRTALSSFLLVLILAFLIHLLTMDHSRPVLELDKSALVSVGPKPAVLVGRVVDRNPYWVEIQKKRFKVEDSGRFEVPITGLSEGAHTLSVRAGDRAGNMSEWQSVAVRVDQTAPTLTFQSKDFRDGYLKLDGLLSEDNCSLKINGQDVEVIARQFRLDIPLSGLTKEITVDIRDSVGLRTVSEAENIFVIRNTGTRLKSLRQAFLKAPLGATLLLFPGVHSCPPLLTRNVEIIGLGEPEEVILRVDRGLTINHGLSVIFRRLTVKSDKRGVDAVIQVREAALSIYNSIITCEGERMIFATSGLQGGGRAVLRTFNTKFHRKYGACVVLENSTLSAEDCQFVDDGAALRSSREFGRASIELRKNSEGRLRRCLINKSRDLGVFVHQSSGFFDDCEFNGSIAEGVLAMDQGKLVFNDCRFTRNNYSGAALTQGCVATFRRCRLDYNGQTSGPNYRRAGLAVLEKSEVDISNSELRGNLGAGVLLERSTANVYRCEMEGNGDGPIRATQSKLTRRENGEN